MRGRLSLAIGLALACGPPAAKATATAAAATDAAESVVEFTINGQLQPATLVVRQDTDGTLLLRAEDLAALRLKPPAGGGVRIDGQVYYRLDTSMQAEVRFDAAAQHAEVRLPADAFQATRSTARDVDTLPALTTSPGGFLNYDLYGESVASQTSWGTIAEAGIFGRHGVGTGTVLGRDDAEGREFVRLDTTWTLDLPARLATLRAGDAVSAAGSWGRSVRFGGLQFGTNFATQPTLVTTPMLSAQGSAVVPSTVDVFVNGSRVASQDVPPGPFTIDHVPAITGTGQMQVVVTDALGRQQVISQPYYTGPALLRAGLDEYSVEVGALRNNYGYESADYGDPMAAATFRRGFTDRFTAEAHAEVQLDGAAAIGLDGAWQVGRFAIVTATAAAGGDDDGTGWLGGLGLEHDGGRVSVFARSQFSSEAFAQFGTADLERRPRQRTFAGFGFDFSRYGSLQLAWGLQTWWSGPRQETIGVSHAVTLGEFGYLNLILSHSTGDDSATDAFLNWTMPLGERRSGGLSVRHSSAAVDDDRFEGVATLQQSLPAGSGLGYQAMLSSSDEAQIGISAQGAAGTATVQYARRNSSDGWRADVSGGLAITGAGVMPARRLDRSFAVVKVADYEGLTVYVENQPVGRTDRAGRVLLDGLRAYERNEVSVDPRELPMDASLGLASMQVTPAFRSGAVVEFPVARSRAVTLRLVRADGQPVPAGATVRVGRESAPVAWDGLVYVADATGIAGAEASWPGGRCRFELHPPEGPDPLPDLGTITCRDVTP